MRPTAYTSNAAAFKKSCDVLHCRNRSIRCTCHSAPAGTSKMSPNRGPTALLSNVDFAAALSQPACDVLRCRNRLDMLHLPRCTCRDVHKEFKKRGYSCD
jgi:hypothetical protein